MFNGWKYLSCKGNLWLPHLRFSLRERHFRAAVYGVVEGQLGYCATVSVWCRTWRERRCWPGPIRSTVTIPSANGSALGHGRSWTVTCCSRTVAAGQRLMQYKERTAVPEHS